MLIFDIYISNIEAYYQYFNLMKNFIQMFNNVNKSYVLQHKFKIYKINQLCLIKTKLLTLYT